MISLLPAFEYLMFIAIHQAGTVPTVLRLRIAAVSEPLSHGSLAHAHLQGNIAGSQALTMKGKNLFIPLLSLSFSSHSCLFLFPGSINSVLLGRYWQRFLLLSLGSLGSYLLCSAPC